MAGIAAEQRHSTSSTAHSEWNGFGFDIFLPLLMKNSSIDVYTGNAHRRAGTQK